MHFKEMDQDELFAQRGFFNLPLPERNFPSAINP
jgi:hypothetical protein